MKYVFHDVFYSASAPKSAQPIIDLFKQSVGSEMLIVYMTKFVAQIREMANNAERKGRARFTVDYRCEVHYNDGRRHGSITLYSPAQYGPKRQASLSFVEVDSMWYEDYKRDKLLSIITFIEWDKISERLNAKYSSEGRHIINKMCYELRDGVPVEEVVDKYTKSATPELRQKLINGLSAIVKKGV